MWIESTKDGSIKQVADRFARTLIALKLAKPYEPQAKPAPPVEKPEISERTGKPKRQYRRRDMRAED